MLTLTSDRIAFGPAYEKLLRPELSRLRILSMLLMQKLYLLRWSDYFARLTMIGGFWVDFQ